MDLAHTLILVAGGLILVSILAGLVSTRIGAPLLLVFLGLGMLAGEDGPGGVQFDDFNAAFLITSVALGVILFDGGLRTPFNRVRAVWAPALSLATAGVIVTAVVAGAGAVYLFGFTPFEGLLVGTLVSSTDAAAVFLLLHQRGFELRPRLGSTLEVESGINDPMAVFLTIAFAEIVLSGTTSVAAFISREFFFHMGIGAAIGLGGGYAMARLVNRLELAPGLYPILALSGALTIFGAASLAHGSGFLAVYLAGIVVGSRRTRAIQLIRRFHDGIAWLSQILMFLLLGLLVTPSELVADLAPGAILAAILMFVARPVAAMVCVVPFGFSWREVVFIAWVGLRGAVPLYLATIPILLEMPDALAYFNVAFVVVLASLIFQGWTIAPLARLLDVDMPPVSDPPSRLEFDLTPDADRELAGYRIAPGCPAATRALSEIAFPQRVHMVAIIRAGILHDRETVDRLVPGDVVLMMTPFDQLQRLDRIFVAERPVSPTLASAMGDFTLSADNTLADLVRAYGLDLPSEREPATTLADVMGQQFGRDPAVGDRMSLGGITLTVRDTDGGRVTQVGLILAPSERSAWAQRAARLATAFHRLR